MQCSCSSFLRRRRDLFVSSFTLSPPFAPFVLLSFLLPLSCITLSFEHFAFLGEWGETAARTSRLDACLGSLAPFSHSTHLHSLTRLKGTDAGSGSQTSEGTPVRPLSLLLSRLRSPLTQPPLSLSQRLHPRSTTSFYEHTASRDSPLRLHRPHVFVLPLGFTFARTSLSPRRLLSQPSKGSDTASRLDDHPRRYSSGRKGEVEQ